jgi:hypothetical protein
MKCAMPLRPIPQRLILLLASAALFPAAGAQADGPLHYQCSTVMHYGPGPCQASVPPAVDESDVEIDLDRKTWKSGISNGPAQGEGNSITLLQWGGQKGRDASIDRGSGAFSYHFQSGCLVENQGGNCKLAPASNPATPQTPAK